MSLQTDQSLPDQGGSLALYQQLAPKPSCLEETGLSRTFLTQLTAKHISTAGALDVVTLAKRLCLPGSIIDGVLQQMRTEALIEVKTSRDGSLAMPFALTDRGRLFVADAFQRDGYLGPAPVPVEVYTELIQRQARQSAPVTRERVLQAFTDVVISTEKLDALGPAMGAGSALFIYGAPGTGKTFIARRLARLLGDPVLVPHAILVRDSVIEYFDAASHRVVATPQEGAPSLRFEEGFDARFVLCERPFVSSGGELTAEMLELQHDATTRRYIAPLQMRANLGMLLIDDLGRQRIAPVELFNRWIVPLEEQIDQLTLHTGHHFSIPFEVVLVFSTNLEPEKLADEAFLRRVGYKVRFEPSSFDDYAAIWQQVCQNKGIEDDGSLLEHVMYGLYPTSGRPMLACHPRDLLGLALDYQRYMGAPKVRTEAIDWAWSNYFVVSSDFGGIQ